VRPNTLKAKLAGGQRAVGVLLTINSPELVELFGHLGYDFVFVDGQHGGLTVETARELIRAADVTGMTALVRVPRNDPSVILEYLDAGAGGIIVPDLVDPAEALAAARATKYAPRGTRGAMTMSRAGFYGVTQSPAEYLRRANEETMFVPLIESAEAIPVIDRLVTVPDVDVVLVGPGDLALSMGIPGGWMDPRVQANVQHILDAAARARHPSMVMALSHEDGRRLIGQGVRALLVNATMAIADAGRAFLAALRA
jgi:2-keto-3-deoxy-L-rhamnonate aldolase RhmA